MRNRRTTKILTGTAIVLGVVLCLLAGALFLEDQDGHNAPTTPGESAPVETQGKTSAGLSTNSNPALSDAPKEAPEEPGQEEAPAETDEQESSEPRETVPKETKPSESRSQEAELGESEAAEPTTSGNEPQTSSRPTEPGPPETVPIDTENMTDEF